MNKYNTVIIGGGVAGILSAIELDDEDSILLEKNDQLAKKIRITGGGRCNITNNNDIPTYMKQYYNNPKFYRKAFSEYFNKDIIELLESHGCKTKVEEEERVFPVSDSAADVQQTLIAILNSCATQYKLNCDVSNITLCDDGFIVEYSDTKIKAHNIIMATGGKSFQKTGSTGTGHRILRNLGHTETKFIPGLASIIVDNPITSQLEGITVDVSIEVKANKKKITKTNGSIVFTSNGISGTVILNNSMIIYEHLQKNEDVVLNMDFVEEYGYEELDNLLQEDFSNNPNKQLKTYLHKFMPRNMTTIFLEHLSIDTTKILNQVGRKERLKIRDNLKRTSFNVTGINENTAFVTASGINKSEINPNTTESKLVENLYITGELIDGCGYSGGYNLQAAYSTGVLAARSIKNKTG
ncbi:MAG: NAD(P)/FAD-dependent oxidoreductase [Methanosphaera sp.]|nr:NAD(P)/FAD-dependent oxidoreductase [Methanosphaera sp.]